MPFIPSSFAVIEDAINRLAAECVLAQPGGNDGLVASYGVLSELAESVSTEPALAAPVVRMQEALEGLIEAARPFDQVSLGALRDLAEWLQEALRAMRNRGDVPAFSAARLASPSSASAPASDSHQPIPNFEDNRDLLAEFHAEASDHLLQIEASLLTLDSHPGNRDALDQLFRSFHTLKGVSGFLHLAAMHSLTHEVEALLEQARSGNLILNPSIITAILDSRDAVQAMVAQIAAALESGITPGEGVPVDPLISRVKALAGNQASETGHECPPVGAPRRINEDPADNIIPLDGISSSAPAMAGPSSPAESGRPMSGAPSTLRVSTEKLDAIMDVVGELVIAHSQIAESAAGLADGNSSLLRHVADLGRITKELQHNAMSLRLVPIKATFQKMERLVRDLSGQCGKKCIFRTAGAETELDRVLAEALADPLVHMIRNALDHGLEFPDARVAAGKPESGTVLLKAYHQGPHVHIELSDDGQGIDPARIHAKAVAKGLIADGASLSHGEITNLIFHPGFSTASAVTSVSGRGVGMDVVRRNIERLGGTIEIETGVGQGTTFRIRLPLTTAIIDGLVVRVGADRFIIPSANLQAAIRPAAAAISSGQGRGEMLDHRGREFPLERLNRRLRIPGAIENPGEGIVLLVETCDKVSALLVDEMIGKQAVVIKNLGGYLAELPGIAGGAILGDGNIALILDPSTLFAA